MDSSNLMSIQIRQAHTRKSSSFLAPVTGTLPYGRRVRVRAEQEDWFHIRCLQTGVTGWLHISALTSKEIIFQANDKDAPISAESGEYALAGKGFNQDVERNFRAQNPHLDFTWINRMETFIVSGRHKQAFLTAGNLKTEGGR